MIVVSMSISKFSKSRKTRLLVTLAVSAFVFVFLMQLIPFANAFVETDFMTMLNAERASLGKSPLALNPSLTTAAYLHSKDMGDNNYFAHTSLDGRTFDQRIRNAGYTGYYSLGENIAYAYGSADAARVYDMWKNSAGHYANMMGDFNEAGLGVYSVRGYTYYTLDLGKRSNPLPPPPSPPPVSTADFSVSSPPTLNIQAGSSGTSTVTVTSINDFSGTVTFTTSSPSGWTVSVNPSSLAVSEGTSKSLTISITVPTGTTAGTYTLTLTGASGLTSHSSR